MTLAVREITQGRDIKKFIDLPFRLYADDPAWSPPLRLERKEHLDKKANPYFLHAGAAYFLAERDGEVVGRISAQVCALREARHGDGAGQFGFLEAIDDQAVFDALLHTAEDWVRARGMHHIEGPFSFSINDEVGLLVDGFSDPPSIMMGHALPWYGARVQACGFHKIKDTIAYLYDARTPLPRAMQAMINKAAASGDVTLRALDKANLARDLDIVISIFNDAWSDNWGFVPMTGQEVAALAQHLKILIAGDYVAIAEYQGEPAAMCVTLPDINLASKDLNGRLLPFGFLKLLWRLKVRAPKAIRMPLMGVRRKYQGTPQGTAMVIAVIDRIRTFHASRGTYRAELSWILEDNFPMRRMIEAIGGVAYKTYRIYGKAL